MSRMTAEMVIDLKDKTGAATQAVIGNLSRLKKAERDYALAQAGVRLTGKDHAHERLLIARQQELEERRKKFERWGMVAATGATIAAAAGVKAYKEFADVESKLNDIAITGEKGFDFVPGMMGNVQAVAKSTATSIEFVTGALATMTTRGMALEQAMDMLPQVTKAARAMGADATDIADSAYSLNNSLGINTRDLTKAFDEMAVAGKLGSFEARDMAKYFPALLPKFANLGYKGTEGLAQIVAMMQVVRKQTGDSSSAATNLGNVLDKLYTQETAKKFAKFGIDSQKTLDKAKKDGKDVIKVLLEMVKVATKGDMTKLSQIFEDTQAQAGIRALYMASEAIDELALKAREASGVIDHDLNQRLQESSAKIQTLSTNWQTFLENLGKKVAPGANEVIDTLNKEMGLADAREAGRKKRGEPWWTPHSQDDFNWRLPFEGGYDDPEFLQKYHEKFTFPHMKGRGLGYIQDFGGAEAELHPFDPSTMPRRPGQRWKTSTPIPQPRPEPPARPQPYGNSQDYSRGNMQPPMQGVDQYRARFMDNADLQSVGPDERSMNDIGERLRGAGADAGAAIAGKMADGGQAAADRMASQAASIGDIIGSAAARRFMSSINIPVAPQSLGSRPPMPGGDMSGVHASTNDSGL